MKIYKIFSKDQDNLKLNDCIRNTTAVCGNAATVTSYCNYRSVMQDVILSDQK